MNEADSSRWWLVRIIIPDRDTNRLVLIGFLLVFALGTVYGLSQLFSRHPVTARGWGALIAVACFLATVRVIRLLRDHS